jgi:hypothetical protein
MSLIYRALYRIGLTPRDTGEVPEELGGWLKVPSRLRRAARSMPAGGPRLNSVGAAAGTGTQSVYLALHGWRVTRN